METAINLAVTSYNAVVTNVEVKQQILLASEGEDLQICQKATDVINQARAFAVDPEALESMLEDLQTLADEQADALDALDAQTCRPPKMKAYRDLVKHITGEFSTWAEKKIDEITVGQATLADRAKSVQDTRDRSGAFWQRFPIGPFSVNTDVDIKVERKELGVPNAEFEVLRELTVNFGGRQRFFMAGGIAASSSDRTRFKIVDGFLLDRKGEFVLDPTTKEPTIGKVVGVEEDSVGRVAPAILLHGMIFRPEKGWLGIDGIGIALGVGAAGSDESVIEYFAGLTTSFADDQLFFTVGAFRGEETKLDGSFYPGAKVPSTVTVIPVVERHSWTLGFGLTYKIR